MSHNKLPIITVGDYSIPVDIANTQEGQRIAVVDQYLDFCSNLVRLRNQRNQILSLMRFSRASVPESQRAVFDSIENFVFNGKSADAFFKEDFVQPPIPMTFNLVSEDPAVSQQQTQPQPRMPVTPLPTVALPLSTQVQMQLTQRVVDREREEKQLQKAAEKVSKKPSAPKRKLSEARLENGVWKIQLPGDIEVQILDQEPLNVSQVPNQYKQGVIDKITLAKGQPLQKKKKQKKDQMDIVQDPSMSQLLEDSQPILPASSSMTPVLSTADQSEVYGDTHRKS